MTSTTTPPPYRDMLPVSAPGTDRLPPMLFLAAVFHALVILGVTFDPDLEFRQDDALTLDVVLLANPDQHLENNDDADYLSQANQEGSGNTEDRVRPGAAPEGLPSTLELREFLGDVAPETAIDATTSTAYVTSRESESTVESNPDPVSETRPQQLDPSAPPAGESVSEPLPAEAENRPDVHDDDPRELVFSVDTRESNLAAYLARWRHKVEIIGTEYYNAEIGSVEPGASPVIEVALDADGELTEIIIVRSSGDGRLDQAALSVLRRAAPYEAIPEPLRKDYDSLRFKYQFEFGAFQ